MAEKDFQPQNAFSLVVRRWPLLAKVCLATAVVAAIINFLILPKWYKATTIIMPPQERSAFSGLGMLLSRMTEMPGGISRIASGLASINPSQFLFVVILNSRTVADSLIDKYNLQNIYKKKYRYEARKALSNHTSIDFPPEGHLVVSVEAKENPELARDLANEYVIQLNNVLLDKGIYTATRKRKFLEERLAEFKSSLDSMEDSLRVFQEQYKIIEPDEQAKGIIELMGMLRIDRESKAIQLRIKETVYTPRHPEVLLLKKQVDELDRAIAKIESEFSTDKALEELKSKIPLTNIPSIAMGYTRLSRSVKIQEEMYLLLSAQYEEARVNEQDDTPAAIVLDQAVTPEYKWRPRRLLNILLSTGAALLLCALYIVAEERIKRGS